MSLRVAMRAACMSLLTDYTASVNPPPKMQLYRARPRKVAAPCAFIDRVTASRSYFGPQNVQETVTATVILLHGPRLPQGGSFDSGDSVDQADAFADGFAEWVDANPHEIGPNTTIGLPSYEDDPTYIPDWVPIEEQMSYYATVYQLEGYAGSTTI